MADSVYWWHIPKDYSGPISLPYFFMETDFEAVALRVHAETAPVEDVLIDIRADGVSIFANLPSKTYGTRGYRTETPSATAVLLKGDTDEPDAADFTGSVIPQGAWLSCHVINKGGAQGLTIQLELDKAGEDNEVE